jgi:hypothetical protein
MISGQRPPPADTSSEIAFSRTVPRLCHPHRLPSVPDTPNCANMAHTEGHRIPSVSPPYPHAPQGGEVEGIRWGKGGPAEPFSGSASVPQVCHVGTQLIPSSGNRNPKMHFPVRFRPVDWLGKSITGLPVTLPGAKISYPRSRRRQPAPFLVREESADCRQRLHPVGESCRA